MIVVFRNFITTHLTFAPADNLAVVAVLRTDARCGQGDFGCCKLDKAKMPCLIKVAVRWASGCGPKEVYGLK
jgi:hypothetical protein